MHENFRFYTIVHSLANFKETLERMLSIYNMKLLAVFEDAVEDFVNQNLSFYLARTIASPDSMYWGNNAWKTFAYYVELKKKK